MSGIAEVERIWLGIEKKKKKEHLTEGADDLYHPDFHQTKHYSRIPTILPTRPSIFFVATTPHPRAHVHRRVGNPGVARDVASLASFDRVVPVIVCLSWSFVDRYYINDRLRESASKS